ncbi:MAG: dTMP kinase [Desulfobacteraceae bacterium]|nr:MAG: dTMP kinase [Desulfobacteraceae bacterium]
MFITLEGIEGSGKTTQLNHIAEFLRKRGNMVKVTREPGATRIGKHIRSILLDPENRTLDPTTELLLYTADRVQHVKEIISPTLLAGGTVLCDRFFDATLVYQGFARGIDIRMIQDLHRILLDGMQPDITFLFDLPPEEGLARAWKQIENGTRTNVETRFERESIGFHEAVRSGYLTLAKQEPNRFRIIDARKSEEAVKNDLLKILTALYD